MNPLTVPPPSPLPPPPTPRPPPPSSTVYAVTAGVALAGVTASDFQSAAVHDGFIAAAASTIGVSPRAVDIVAVTDIAPNPAGGRRLAQTASVPVDSQAFLLSMSAAAAASSTIASAGGVTVSALQSAGIAVTGVALTTAPVVAVLPAPDA